MPSWLPGSSSKSSNRGHGSGKKSSSSSPPSHKSSKSSESHKPPKASMPPSREKQLDGGRSCQEEAESVWKMIKKKDGRSDTTILAVTQHGYEDSLKALVKRKDINSKVLVSTPENLQKVIDSKIQKGCKTLQLLVSTTVRTISYCISKVVKDVHVIPCSSNGRPDALRIGSLSTYCGIKTYAWDRRPEGDLRMGGYQITHEEGCHWDISDDKEAMRLLCEPVVASDLKEEELANIRNHAAKFRDEVMRGPGSASGKAMPVSSSAAPSTPPCTDDSSGTESWFSKCKAFLAIVLGAGAGIAGVGGAFWCGAGGFFIKGPLGFSLSAGYFSGAAAGGACITGGGTFIAAAAAVYFIPWEKVFDYAKWLLFRIWDCIRDVFEWIWEKVETLASTAISMVTVLASKFS